MKTQIETVSDLIEFFDGPTKLGRAVGQSPQSIVNWRGRGRVPPEYYLKLTGLLKRRKAVADPKVFGMIT